MVETDLLVKWFTAELSLRVEFDYEPEVIGDLEDEPAEECFWINHVYEGDKELDLEFMECKDLFEQVIINAINERWDE